jgi:PRTRC genetic system protein B
MENITDIFNETYAPVKALVIHQSQQNAECVYVEAYDISSNGKPVNAHPLSVKETIALAESLNTSSELKNDYLKSKGLLPDKVLYIHPSTRGFAIWHTPVQEVGLLFKESLQITCGKAFVPPLLWKADKNNLYLYAVKTQGRPSVKTPLFRAPFFNLYEDDRVCMGTVDMGMDKITCLEDFMTAWERCYWNSYFSHLIGEISPVGGNIVQLWQQQVNTQRKFPQDVLKAKDKTIKDLII